MPFSTPTLNDFVRIAENGLSTEFYGEEAVLRKSVLKVLARVFAGTAFLLVLLLQKMWKNGFIATCDVETLKDFGTDFDLPNKPESYARGRVLVKKTVSDSVVVSQGTILVADSGAEFEIDSDYELSGEADSTFLLNVIAVQSGSESNFDQDAKFSFRDGTPEGIDDEVGVYEDGISGGVRIEVVVNGNTELWGETVEEYRMRLLNYRRTQPHGGCKADYKSWCERFACVSRCVVHENYPETNSVTCVLAYYGDSGDASGVNSDNLAEVSDYVKSDVRRSVTADVRVVSCIPKTINFVIALSPDNGETESSVTVALKNVLRSYEPGDTVSSSDLMSKLKGSVLAEEFVVTSVGSGDSVELSKELHELPVVGNISWQNING